MQTYTVYVTRNQISRNNRKTGLNGDAETVAYLRNVKATGCRDAAEKCIGDIWDICDDDIKVISIYAGIKGNVSAAANRLTPVQFCR